MRAGYERSRMNGFAAEAAPTAGYHVKERAREINEGKHLVVVYRESGNDGFIITAFLTRKLSSLERRKQIWPK